MRLTSIRPRPLAALNALFGWVGRRVSVGALYLVDLVVFLLAVLRSARRRGMFNRASYHAILNQIIFSGVDALPAASVLGLAAGVTITAQTVRYTEVVGGTQADMASILTQTVVLELGPLLAAVILVGRSASAIAVDLGNMKLRRELDGLAVLGVDIVNVFVWPRVAGMVVAHLALAFYFSAFAIVSGFLLLAFTESVGYLRHLAAIPLLIGPADIGVFVFKNLSFGLIMGTTACFHAMRVGDSPTELPQQTQRAIMAILTLIFLLDGLLAMVLP